MRVVLDTNILVRANPTVSPQGLARDLLLTVLSGPHVPDDDQTAIVGRADIVCTRDAAFRYQIVEQVCIAHGIRILDDISLLQELRRSSPT